MYNIVSTFISSSNKHQKKQLKTESKCVWGVQLGTGDEQERDRNFFVCPLSTIWLFVKININFLKTSVNLSCSGSPSLKLLITPYVSLSNTFKQEAEHAVFWIMQHCLGVVIPRVRKINLITTLVSHCHEATKQMQFTQHSDSIINVSLRKRVSFYETTSFCSCFWKDRVYCFTFVLKN